MVAGFATPRMLLPEVGEKTEGPGGEVVAKPNPEGPIRLPIWNYGPKTIYGMAVGL